MLVCVPDDVFLTVSIVEQRDKGHTTHEAIARGLFNTGYVITAAGVIMAIAFVGLVLACTCGAHLDAVTHPSRKLCGIRSYHYAQPVRILPCLRGPVRHVRRAQSPCASADGSAQRRQLVACAHQLVHLLLPSYDSACLGRVSFPHGWQLGGVRLCARVTPVARPRNYFATARRNAKIDFLGRHTANHQAWPHSHTPHTTPHSPTTSNPHPRR